MVFDGLTSTFDELHMVQQNSKVARERHFARGQTSGPSVHISVRRRLRTPGGWRRDRPVDDVTDDEGIRRDTTLEKLVS
jgi:hypothetical protein